VGGRRGEKPEGGEKSKGTGEEKRETEGGWRGRGRRVSEERRGGGK